MNPATRETVVTHIQKFEGGQNGHLPASVGRCRLPPQQDLSVALGTRAQRREERKRAQVADCLVGGVPLWSASMGHHLRHVAELDCGFGRNEWCSGNAPGSRSPSPWHN